MKEITIIVLRWIAILPAATVSYVFGYLFLIFTNWLLIKFYFTTNGDGGYFTEYLMPLIATGISSYFFIVIGTAVAPSKKSNVALILTILISAFSCFIFFISIVNLKNYVAAFASIAQLIGALYGYSKHKNVLED